LSLSSRAKPSHSYLFSYQSFYHSSKPKNEKRNKIPISNFIPEVDDTVFLQRGLLTHSQTCLTFPTLYEQWLLKQAIQEFTAPGSVADSHSIPCFVTSTNVKEII